MIEATDAGIIWGSPPPRCIKGRSDLWAERLAPFKERPGEWGEVVSDEGSHAWGIVPYLKRRQAVGALDAEYRFRASTKGTARRANRQRIWACYGRPMEGPDPHDC